MATATIQRASSRSEWSPARIYLVVSGVLLLFIAIAGFTINRAFPTGAGEVSSAGTAHLFGVLETNGWHNLAGLLSAIVALGFALRAQWARTGALLKGVFYVGVTASVAIWGPHTFWIAANTPDQFLHGALGVGGLLTGFWTTSETGAP